VYGLPRGNSCFCCSKKKNFYFDARGARHRIEPKLSTTTLCMQLDLCRDRSRPCGSFHRSRDSLTRPIDRDEQADGCMSLVPDASRTSCSRFTRIPSSFASLASCASVLCPRPFQPFAAARLDRDRPRSLGKPSPRAGFAPVALATSASRLAAY
jgi:hypothetical protein